MAKVDLASFTPDLTREPDTIRPAASLPGVRELPIADVATNPLNARTADDEDHEELQQLADTIALHGVLQPIVVCAASAFLEQFPDQVDAVGPSGWVALIGNRRVIATRRAGVDTIRALVDSDALTSIDEVMLIENSQRRDLHPLREADAIGRLRERDGLSIREIGRRIGRTHVHVQHRLHLLSLIPALKAAVEDGSLTVKRARDLGAMTKAEQEDIAAAGPPWNGTGNRVTTRRRPAGPTLPIGDLQAAARAIRETYASDQLPELIRLLSSTDDVEI